MDTVIFGTNASGTETHSCLIRAGKASLHWVNSQTLQAVGQSNLAAVSTNIGWKVEGRTYFDGKRVSVYWLFNLDTRRVIFTLKTVTARPVTVLERNEVLL